MYVCMYVLSTNEHLIYGAYIYCVFKFFIGGKFDMGEPCARTIPPTLPPNHTPNHTPDIATTTITTTTTTTTATTNNDNNNNNDNDNDTHNNNNNNNNNYYYYYYHYYDDGPDLCPIHTWCMPDRPWVARVSLAQLVGHRDCKAFRPRLNSRPVLDMEVFGAAIHTPEPYP